jgi:hypothetical protein
MQISIIPLGIKWSGRVRSFFGEVLAWVRCPFTLGPSSPWGLTSLGSSLHLAVVLGLHQVSKPVEDGCRRLTGFAIDYGESLVVPLG